MSQQPRRLPPHCEVSGAQVGMAEDLIMASPMSQIESEFGKGELPFPRCVSRFLKRLHESRIESGHVNDLVVRSKVALDERVSGSLRLGVSVVVSHGSLPQCSPARDTALQG
jgi:hypothetical protein